MGGNAFRVLLTGTPDSISSPGWEVDRHQKSVAAAARLAICRSPARSDLAKCNASWRQRYPVYAEGAVPPCLSLECDPVQSCGEEKRNRDSPVQFLLRTNRDPELVGV